MSEKEETKEIGQISIYLAKPGKAFNEVINWDEGLRAKRRFSEHQLDLGDAACSLIYFETLVPKANPPWLEFANSKLTEGERITFRATSKSANGILGLAIDGHLFIATFGRSAGACLVRKALEPDFGIKAAMNLCGSDEIRQTRTQSHSITPTHIDRQVAQPSDSFSFGLGESEDLRAISAHMKSDPRITLQGRDHLTIKIIGDEKLGWEDLVRHCRVFIGAYDKRDYVDLFPNYRNFKSASEPESEELDGLLISKLRKGDFSDIKLWIPEFVPDDEYSYSYADREIKENTIYSFLSPDQLASEMKLDSITAKSLKAKRIYAYSHADSRVVSEKWWSLYDCVIFEHKLRDGYFLLSNGDWRLVDPQFYDTVTNFIKTQVREEPCEALYANISIANVKEMKNKEEMFNAEACERRPQTVHFDQAKLKIGGGRKDKEFCDFLDLTDDGVMRIINCKPYKGSTALTYLFAQTRFYCESFLKDKTFLDAIRDHISKSTSPTKDLYLRHIGTELQDVNGSDYQICVWLLCDARDPLPTKTDLPLIAQYELKLMHDQLRQVCKYRDIVLRFIPVTMVTFTKKVPPTKKAA